jgi:hypothetical protein
MKTHMSDSDLFNRVMEAGLRQWLDEQASVRSAAKAEEIQRFGVGLVGGVIVGVAGFLFTNETQFAFAAGAILMAIAWNWASAPVREVTQGIKVRANEELAAAMGITYRPHADPSADYDTATSMGFLPSSFDQSYYTDFWEGDFDGVNVNLHEAHLLEYRQSGKNRTLVTVFRGVIVGYPFMRNFQGTTLVQRDKGLFNGLVGFGKKVWGQRFEPVRMVDPDFERQFEVYSTDQVEARYLVHPAFCERLKDVQSAFHASNVQLMFQNGRVIIVLATDDQFESGGIDANGDEARISETVSQIGSLISLTKVLNERARG